MSTPTKCCGPSGPVPLTGPLPAVSDTQHNKFFAVSLQQWAKAEAVLVEADVHAERFAQCKACEFYAGFWCTKCRCIAYAKTKLAAEQCPDNPPRWLAVVG